jgi:hypothetical protein
VTTESADESQKISDEEDTMRQEKPQAVAVLWQTQKRALSARWGRDPHVSSLFF